jgi:hypothetical protein
LCVHAATAEDAVEGVERLMGLDRGDYRRVSIVYDDDLTHLDDELQLARLLQLPGIGQRFSRVDLSAEYSRVLGASAGKSQLVLLRCRFEDGGSAFVDAFAQSDGQEGTLALHSENPFDLEPWNAFLCLLQEKGLKHLEVYNALFDADGSEALAVAKVEKLSLCFCHVADGGNALSGSIERVEVQENFPCTVRARHRKVVMPITFSCCHSSERYEAKAANFKVFRYGFQEEKRTKILNCWKHSQTRWSKTRVCWAINTGRISLELFRDTLSCGSWNLHVIPLLVLITLLREKKKVARTKAIAAMLSTNEQVDEIPFDDSIFNRAEYASRVAPRLECNLHRKRFRQIGTSSARRALVGAALSKVNTNRSLIFLLVSQNHDLVADVFRNR